MIKERYQAGTSLIHQLDPRVKVVVSFALILGIVSTPEKALPAYPLLWTLISSLAAVSQLGVWRLAKLGGLALPFTLVAATQLFTLKGQPILTIWGLTVSEAGLARFLSLGFKSWLALQVGLLLAMTTAFPDLLWALKQLHLPRLLVEIIAFMYRYLSTLQNEALALLQARASRSGSADGQKTGGSLRWRAQVTGSMIGNLFLRSYERSERVYMAMLARGYNGYLPTTAPTPIPLTHIVYGTTPLGVLLVIQVLSVIWWQN